MQKRENIDGVKHHIPNHKGTLLEELLGLMEKQRGLYVSLKSALFTEKQQIVNMDLKGLAETGQFKEGLLVELQRLEKDRVHLMKDLSALLQVSFQDMTVGRLMTFSHGYYKNRIEKLRDKLLKLAGQIKQMNLLNKQLVQHTLELIKGSYSFLSQLATPDPVYQSSGGLRLRHQPGKFLSNNI